MDTLTQLTEEAEELFEAFDAGEIVLSSQELETLDDFMEEKLHAINELKSLVSEEVDSGLRFGNLDDL